MAVEEERELSEAYRSTKRVRRPEGQGLNDLYVRFFRMAERRIAEKTGRGVICFISNYSWLDGLSFTGMRERYLEAFDAIRIDCLNGDKYKTSKVAPDGSPDPSIFSTEGDPVGIQVGTAIATLVRKADHPGFCAHFTDGDMERIGCRDDDPIGAHRLQHFPHVGKPWGISLIRTTTCGRRRINDSNKFRIRCR